MKASRVLVVVAFAALFARAQQPAPQFAEPNLTDEGVRSLAAACSMCHGDSGRPARGSHFPSLAGRPAGELVAAMNDFKQGRGVPTVMHQIAKGYGDAELAALGEYFAKRAP